MKLGQFSDEAISAAKQLLSDSIEFSELETMDFARCQRPDGTFYGTSGQCRKGKDVGAKEKVEPKGKSGAKTGAKLEKASGDDIAAAITPKMEAAFQDMVDAATMDDLESIDGYANKNLLPDRMTAEEIFDERDEYEDRVRKAEEKLQTLKELRNKLSEEERREDRAELQKNHIKATQKELEEAREGLLKAEEKERNLEDFYGDLSWQDRQYIYGRKRGSSEADAFDRLDKDAKVLATGIQRNLKKKGKTTDLEELQERLKDHISSGYDWSGSNGDSTLKELFED